MSNPSRDFMEKDAYGPGAVDLMDDALAAACREASHHVIMDEEGRLKLAVAIMEGVQRGLLDRDELAAFALQSVPKARRSAERAVP